MSNMNVVETHPTEDTEAFTGNQPDSVRHASGTSFISSFDSTLQRHPEIWFDDGNIVLVAGEIAFRVYRGLLAAQSTIFCDMFTSSTSSPREEFDGCPAVQVFDSPHDLAYLLRVLLPKSQINYRTTKEDTTRTFDEVAAVIRLAHKYDIPQVQTQALASLQAHNFPSTFAAFSAPSSDRPEVKIEPAHFIGVVNLARLTDSPLMLPMALYRCAYLGSALVDGWTHEDGTTEHLCTEDLKRCIDARTMLERERTFSLVQLFHNRPSDGCRWPAKCVASLRYLYASMVRMDFIVQLCQLQGNRQVVEAFRSRAEALNLEHWGDVVRNFIDVQGGAGDAQVQGELCEACGDGLHERNRREQKKIFDKLPKIFGIEVEGWGKENSKGEQAVA